MDNLSGGETAKRTEQAVKADEIPDWAKFQVSLTTHLIIRDENGTLRYKLNPLTQWLCDQINLNDMWIAYQQGLFSRDEFMQFYREIGYSLSGFEEVWGEDLDEMERDAGH